MYKYDSANVNNKHRHSRLTLVTSKFFFLSLDRFAYYKFLSSNKICLCYEININVIAICNINVNKIAANSNTYKAFLLVYLS